MTELPVSHSGWEDIQTSLASVKDLLDACYSAWGPEDQKVRPDSADCMMERVHSVSSAMQHHSNALSQVSATTKKRLAARALKGLEQGQELLKVLLNSHQWKQQYPPLLDARLPPHGQQ